MVLIHLDAFEYVLSLWKNILILINDSNRLCKTHSEPHITISAQSMPKLWVSTDLRKQKNVGFGRRIILQMSHKLGNKKRMKGLGLVSTKLQVVDYNFFILSLFKFCFSRLLVFC